MKCQYFTLVGISPLAVSNSLIWLIRSRPDINIDKVHFICSMDDPDSNTKGSYGFHEKVKDSIIEQLNELNLNSRIPNFDDKVILISEANLPESAKIIGNELLKIPSDIVIIFDCTAGRKTMTAAAVIANLLLISKFKREIYINYYWLLKYTRENLRKKATELGLDEAEIKLFTHDMIIKSLEEIKPD
ncbi:MAG: hypothetical protein ACFFD2_15395 [Promethearchaeota archaeon]